MKNRGSNFMNTNENIEQYIKLSKNNTDDIVIIVVGNARGITKDFDDFSSGTSVSSEYYALERFRKIVLTLRQEGFEVVPYYDEMDFIYDYLTHRIRNNYYKKMLVFNFAQKGLVHGRKSLVPLFCEMNNILHTNSDPFVSSFVREKYYWYKLLKGVAPVCETWIFDSINSWIDGYPTDNELVIAKLENQCSSMGIDQNSVFQYNESKNKLLTSLANNYNSRIVVQKFISGYEIEVPFIYDGKNFICLKPQGISIDGSIYIGNHYLDYNARGQHLFSFYNFDEQFSDITPDILLCVEKVAKVIDIKGMGRIDLRVDDNFNFYVTDINSNPHLIEVASPAEALRQMGFPDYSSLLHLIIGITLNRHPNQIK